MNKTSKIMVCSLLLMFFFAISFLVSRKGEPPLKHAFDNNKDKVKRYNMTLPSTDSKIDKRIESSGDFSRVDPFEVVEKFDTRFAELLIAEDHSWELGLEELASIVNRLGGQSDFQSVTISALMVARISDLAIAKLMAGDITPKDTLNGLERFTYSIPNERRLIGFICELYPGGEEQRRKNPPRSVNEFVSRFEEEPIIPYDEWTENKTATGIASRGNAMARLLYIEWAKFKLDTAKIVAIYLQRGGDPNFKGVDLEANLSLLVGQEIEKLPIPLFGDELPTAGTIGFLIDNAKTRYPRK